MPDPRLPSFDDVDLILVSALEHWSYCPRQCALIHLDKVWDENLYTLRGEHAHEKVDVPDTDIREGIKIERALPIWSDRLGLIGKADVVEYHGAIPYPIEYKHGGRRRHVHDEVQLCSQALCLEDMTGQTVPQGAVYHFSSRRRREVEFSAPLRERTEEAVRQVRALLRGQRLPPPVNDARCENCSLRESCLPTVVADVAGLRAARRTLFSAEPSGRESCTKS